MSICPHAYTSLDVLILCSNPDSKGKILFVVHIGVHIAPSATSERHTGLILETAALAIGDFGSAFQAIWDA